MFEAVACSWGSGSAPAVSTVMDGAPMRNKIAKTIGEITYGRVFGNVVCIHWYDIHKCRLNVFHSDERTRLNCSMVFVTVFVSSDGSTFRLCTAVDCVHVTASVIACVNIIIMYTSEANN